MIERKMSQVFMEFDQIRRRNEEMDRSLRHLSEVQKTMQNTFCSEIEQKKRRDDDVTKALFKCIADT